MRVEVTYVVLCLYRRAAQLGFNTTPYNVMVAVLQIAMEPSASPSLTQWHSIAIHVQDIS